MTKKKHNITDQLKLYRGSPHKVNENIVIHMPTLGDICDYGEAEYYRMVYNLCSVGIDLCWQLDEIGVNFDEITDYELFVKYLCRGYDTEQTRILFGNKINFKKMIPLEEKDGSIILTQIDVVGAFLRKEPTSKSKIICQIPIGSVIPFRDAIHELTYKNENYYKVNYCGNIGYISSKFVTYKDDSFCVYDPGYLQYSDDAEYEILTIDEATYYEIVTYLRAMHNLQRDDRIAGSRSCRAAFIEDAKMEYDTKKNEPYKSVLLSMISTMVNIDGFKRNDSNIWDMNIFAFMDSVKRVNKIKNSSLLLQSGYSGFGIDLKKINKEEINYMGELN